MARKVFFSFHYKPDNWRASQVRNAGMVEGNASVSDNDWETITSGGDAAIQRWIDGQLYGKSCAVVLIGTATAGRKWINYEIEAAWNSGKGLVGIHIHCALAAKPSRLSRSWPVTSFTVNPSRFSCANDAPKLIESFINGPEMPPRTPHDP